MSKRYLLIVFIILNGSIGFGQNLPQFTHYVFNSFYLNPGAAGQFNRIQIQSTVRSQYLGYTASQASGGAMLSSTFSADMPVANLKGGVGIHFANQNISQAQSKSEMVLSYAYHKRINNNIVGFGVGAGVNNLSLNGNEYIIRDPNDPFIPDTKINSMSPQVNVGIFILNPSYQLGLSAKNLLESSYNISGVSEVFKEKREYYLTGKYDIPVGYYLDISPMFLIQSDLVSTTTEVGVLGTYNNRFWTGLSYRHQDAVSFLIGTSLLENKLRLGYAIDAVTQGVEAKSRTSHEIFLKYMIQITGSGKKSIVKTPRYSIP